MMAKLLPIPMSPFLLVMDAVKTLQTYSMSTNQSINALNVEKIMQQAAIYQGKKINRQVYC